MAEDKPNESEEWLSPAHVTCPNCGEQLYRHDHSPMLDNYLLYCDRCANRVEVDFYDPVMMKIHDRLESEHCLDYKHKMQEMEDHLRPCECGGRYRDGAPRRCHTCLAIVIADETGVDLWPVWFDTGEPTEEEIAVYEQFERKHIRRDNLWK